MKVLLVGPYDPFKGEFSFSAPPLGIWRICGFLMYHRIQCSVFDPNLSSDPYTELGSLVSDCMPDIIGFSLTGMTLPYDLSLTHWAKRHSPDSLFVAGGIEAAFNYTYISSKAPFDYCVLGEGEMPMLKICTSLRDKGYIEWDIPGIGYMKSAQFQRNSAIPLDYERFRFVTSLIPYHEIPIRAYWEKVSGYDDPGCRKEAGLSSSLQEIRSIRIMTSNYCPMKCTFCSYTNFLSYSCAEQNVKLVRLSAADIITKITEIVDLYPDVRTIIFQDDLFIRKNDSRIVPLCEHIIQLKEDGRIPRALSFMATTRVDSMETMYLKVMKKAGFRLIGYGIESFSESVLREYGKERIYTSIEKVLDTTLICGIKPFLDIILVSPESTFFDVARTLNKCVEYIMKGCEVSIYPSVIPFSGAEITRSPEVKRLIDRDIVEVSRTDTKLLKNTRIQPRSRDLKIFIRNVHDAFEDHLRYFREVRGVKRLPSRLRSLLYILSVVDTYPDLLRIPKIDIMNQIYSEGARLAV